MITLTTDFGNSHYVAQVKSSILKINPKVRILDITHEIPPHDVISGSYVLYTTLPLFPGSVHICVVDPGVGTARRGVIVECVDSFLVGPDNGLMVDTARKLGIRGCYRIPEPGLDHKTFHGRDIFAPVGALLNLRKDPKDLGEEMDADDLVDPSFLDLEFGKSPSGKYVKGKILFIDRFGDCVTSLAPHLLTDERPLFEIDGRKMGMRFLDTYAHSDQGEVVAITSSSGFLELASFGQDCSEILGLRVGDPIILFKPYTP